MLTQERFLAWLAATPVRMQQFLALIHAFYQEVGAPAPRPPTSSPGGPPAATVGGPPPPLATTEITQQELAALSKDEAEAAAVEKKIVWIKGFLAGITVGVRL